ncbi:DOMON-like domain-containing protein [Sphingomonas sp. GC_Shp_3]|uniref:DOMON-like domain-containing protein n=1 Tax=Sphingomonas sp. GC_Shp_3 TaxID=2937383 RepID=UPI00226AC2AC|nr:DOMON-like domain-containing protein [Sphingomonas sp. GC_Shp_3]
MSDAVARPRPAAAKGEWALVPHPDTPASAVEYVHASVRQSEYGLDLAYVIGCPTDRLVVPAAVMPARADGLWRSTCLELFVQTGAPGYLEFNFSPSSAWAAYRFTDYRTGMAEMPLDVAPRIMVSADGDALIVIARIAPPLSVASVAGLSAVIEEADGTKSYWALAHGDGPPDFHNAEGFVAALPAPA